MGQQSTTNLLMSEKLSYPAWPYSDKARRQGIVQKPMGSSLAEAVGKGANSGHGLQEDRAFRPVCELRPKSDSDDEGP